MKKYSISFKQNETSMPESKIVWGTSNQNAKKLFKSEHQGMQNAIIISCKLIK